MGRGLETAEARCTQSEIDCEQEATEVTEGGMNSALRGCRLQIGDTAGCKPALRWRCVWSHSLVWLRSFRRAAPRRRCKGGLLPPRSMRAARMRARR